MRTASLYSLHYAQSNEEKQPAFDLFDPARFLRGTVYIYPRIPLIVSLTVAAFTIANLIIVLRWRGRPRQDVAVKVQCNWMHSWQNYALGFSALADNAFRHRQADRIRMPFVAVRSLRLQNKKRGR